MTEITRCQCGRVAVAYGFCRACWIALPVIERSVAIRAALPRDPATESAPGVAGTLMPRAAMNWWQVTRADPRANAVAKRHYTCQSPESDQYVPPGRCLCLYSTQRGRALWVTSWPLTEYVKHDWPGAWMCSIFRNESRVLASVLIRRAVAATRWYFGEPPTLGMVTFIDPRYVRAKEQMGRCFLEAGFELCGETRDAHLPAFRLDPRNMPEPCPPLGAQLPLSANLSPGCVQ